VGARFHILAAAVFGAGACSSGLEDLSLGTRPLAVLHAQASPEVLAASQGETLRAVLVWAGLRPSDVPCLRYGPTHPKLAAACPDPYGFLPAEPEPMFPAADSQGRFTFELTRLPPATVSVGDARGRVAWASVLAVADRDGDGIFSLGSAPTPKDGMEPPPGIGPGRGPGDRIVGASFFSLREPQDRVGFREGTWDAFSWFYPAPGCGEPPGGYFVLHSGPYPNSVPSTLEPCTISAPEQAVPISRLSDEQVHGLECGGRRTWSVSPESGIHGGVGDVECLTSEVLAIVSPGDCPLAMIMPLAGCWDDPFCEKPDWDFRTHPPDDWPCGTTP